MAGTLRDAVRSQSPRLILSAWLALALMAGAVLLIAYYVPEDVDQGLSQKIFYFHVPIALTAYAFFGWGAWKAFRHLWRRQEGADLESYSDLLSIWASSTWGVLTSTLYRIELAGKRIDLRLRELRESLA